MACKEGQFDAVEVMVNDQFKTFSINLNAQHVNGMTPYDYLYSEWNLTEKLLKIGLNGKHLFHRYLFAHIACSVKAQKVA